MSFRRTVKISSKGQITLPKPVRDALGTDLVQVMLDDGGAVKVVPVPELGGILQKYAKNVDPKLSWEQIRSLAWESELGGKHKSKRR